MGFGFLGLGLYLWKIYIIPTLIPKTFGKLIITDDGVEKIFIIDDNGNEIPFEKADNVIEIKTKVNNYDTFDTVGVSCSLNLSESDSCVTLRAEIMY